LERRSSLNKKGLSNKRESLNKNGMLNNKGLLSKIKSYLIEGY